MKGKKILITGGTGSWGGELTKQLLEKDVEEIRIFSRNEFLQVTMARKFNNPKLKFIIGDVRELFALKEACKDVDIVFHLSALKHIPVCEDYPWEAVRTNVEGTRNVIEAAIAMNVKKVIDVSSDKAVSPLNLYGMTKAVGEKLIIQANKRGSNTQFVCIRGGNVLGSNGSVVPFFLKKIADGDNIPITDMRMTRYFLTLPEAIKLLFTAAESDISGSVFVMKMPACKIVEMACVMLEEKGSNEQTIEEVGIRQGEKLHEVLVSREEAPYTYEWGNDYYIIDFSGKINGSLKKVEFEEYNSGQALMNMMEIREMLKRGGFLQ